MMCVAALDTVHTIDSRVWVPDERLGWVKGSVRRIEGTKVVVLTDAGATITCESCQAPVQNPDGETVNVSV